MPSPIEQTAVRDQRQGIPTNWLLEFDGLTNEDLEWVAINHVRSEIQSYAGWELEYRGAFGLDFFLRDGEFVRGKA